MLSAFQMYGQPMFDTLESWIKLGMVRRARKLKGRKGSEGSISNNMSDVEKAELKSERRWVVLLLLGMTAWGRDGVPCWVRWVGSLSHPTPVPCLLTALPCPCPLP